MKQWIVPFKSPNIELEPTRKAMLAFLLFICAGSAAIGAQMHIEVRDETGQAIWARLEVRGPKGEMYQPKTALLDHSAGTRSDTDRYYLGSFVVEGSADLDLPADRYTVIAEHGLEYERVEKVVDLTVQKAGTVVFQLRPWIRMQKLGWYSGDMHLHRTPDDTPALTLAEDLNLGVVFTMWNRRNLWKDRPFPKDSILTVAHNHFVTLLNAEDERAGGAWLLHNLKEPLALEVENRFFPSGINFVRRARVQKSSPEALFPWFDCEKPTWWEVPVMMALAPPDSIGVIHNHFNQYNVLSNEAWGRPRDPDLFPGRDGFVNYSLGLYYRYLNLNFRIPPSGGSASGVLPSPSGYSRVYVPIEDPFTVEKWYSAFRNGPSFVTNGPMLFLETKKAGPDLKIAIEARSREPIDRVEIVANGKIVKRFPANSRKIFKTKFSFSQRNHSWVAVRCFLANEHTVRMAHSSPIYLDGRWDEKPDAQYFIQWIDDLIAKVTQDLSGASVASQRQQLLSMYREARQVYVEKAKQP